ncbi:MAG TPA: hypothetical protein VFR73_23665 [Hyphomicrobiaceae bacterium]|nr:hypothetical protein [Hyphomicrobiaceae bacterium]
MTLPPSPTRPPKLPFWRTVGACYAIVFGNFGSLLRISWLWLLIMLPVYAAAEWLDSRSQGNETGSLLLSMLPSVLEVPALASIAVAWHRLVLRQESVQGAVYLRLDRVVWWYAMILLACMVATIGPILFGIAAVLPHNVSSQGALSLIVTMLAGFGVGLGVGVFVLPRLSLVLPAGALGERLTLGEAWRATRGNTWRLACASLLCSLPPLIPAAALVFLVEGTSLDESVIGITVYSLAYVLIVTIAVTLLSLAYRHFVERPGASAAQVA